MPHRPFHYFSVGHHTDFIIPQPNISRYPRKELRLRGLCHHAKAAHVLRRLTSTHRETPSFLSWSIACHSYTATRTYLLWAAFTYFVKIPVRFMSLMCLMGYSYALYIREFSVRPLPNFLTLPSSSSSVHGHGKPPFASRLLPEAYVQH